MNDKIHGVRGFINLDAMTGQIRKFAQTNVIVRKSLEVQVEHGLNYQQTLEFMVINLATHNDSLQDMLVDCERKRIFATKDDANE